MAERAHPDHPGFKVKWRLRLWKTIIPWIHRYSSPYREALFWRYGFANKYCTGMDVLDIPCGMGWGTSLLKGCHYLIGVDISHESIIEAQRRYGAKTTFLVGNMDNLGFSNNAFDLICCLEGIEHVSGEVAKAFISECSRLLRPGGLLIVSSPHCTTGEHSGNPYHLKEYKPDDLKTLIEPYFEILLGDSRSIDNLIVSIYLGTKLT